MTIVLPTIGIFLSLIFLIGMAYRGHSVVAIAPLAAMIALVFSWDHILAGYTQIFMPAGANFIAGFFPLFLAGAIFGRLMTVSGYAEDIARWIPQIFGPKQAIFITAIITAILTYGGINAWVIAFTVVPIAKPLFKEANISMRLMPAAIALGIFTFATAALPGSPQIHNAIPTRYFQTTTFAAPLLGILGTIVTFGLGMMWLKYREKSMAKSGEGFVDLALQNEENEKKKEKEKAAVAAAESKADSDLDRSYGDDDLDDDPTPGTVESAREAVAAGEELAARNSARSGNAPLGHGLRGGLTPAQIQKRGLVALIPILLVIIVNALYVYVISKYINFDYLGEQKYGGVQISAVLGIWAVTLGLFVAGIFIFVLKPSKFKDYVNSLTEGARNAAFPVFTTASEVGYGAVIASLAVFTTLKAGLFNITDNAVLLGVIATATISGITGSSSGGLSITLQTFGEQLAQMATDQGISLEFMHRAMAMASVSLDSLPHNGAIVTLLVVCGLTHRQAYKDIAMVTVLVPVVGVLAILALGLGIPALQ